MAQTIRTTTSTIDIYIKLAQYPILAREIRSRMREELFRRGIISFDDFEAEVKAKAIDSQRREGVYDPFSKEPASVWQERKERIREFQTDFYFGHNLPTSLFEQIIHEVRANQPQAPASVELSFNPELAPWVLLFRQGLVYESLPPPEREKINHHLEEIKAVLIKGMISDQLPYIGVARKVFDISDLQRIHRRRIGRGKIGGKAAGMLLAWKILQQQDPEVGPDISEQISIPESYFIATEVIYEFRLLNNLDHLMNQKYRPLDEIRSEYPNIVEAHLKGKFPERIVDQLRELLEQINQAPLIVRSSSLLEDNFGFSFAGKYQSYFCPNQGTPEQNLDKLLEAIKLVYASSLNPDAILYRQKNNLIDYDERMAILLQIIQGQRHGRYFFPAVAGVGFSQNSLRWNPKIRREDGFLRLVWGMGTRAVDRIGNDYARLVALSHPHLRPEMTAKSIRQYSQKFIDVIDLQDNEFKTLPAREVLKEVINEGYPVLRYIVSVDKGEYVETMVSNSDADKAERLLVTFDYLNRERDFVKLMRMALMRIEQGYERPVDVEFTVEITPGYPNNDFRLHLLQCRPLSERERTGEIEIPTNLDPDSIIFSSHHLVPDGKAEGIRYIIFVDPNLYRSISDRSIKMDIGRAIGRLNKSLENKSFIMIGPGRWGSSNIDLGVRVSYADIYNTKVLVELAVAVDGVAPALSYGTHFYQDLVETGIHSLPLQLEDPRSVFKWEFFQEAHNFLADFSPEDGSLESYLKVIDITKEHGGKRLNILMNSGTDEAIGFITEGNWKNEDDLRGTLSTF